MTSDQKAQVVNDLLKLRIMLTLPDSWTRRVFARNAEGLEVTMMSSRATCWCISGALSVVCLDPGGRTARYQNAHDALLVEARKEMPGINYLVNYNDNRKHPEILALIDRTLTELHASPSYPGEAITT